MDGRRSRTASLHNIVPFSTSLLGGSALRGAVSECGAAVGTPTGIESRRLQPLRVGERVGVPSLLREAALAGRQRSRSNSCTTSTQPAPSLFATRRRLPCTGPAASSDAQFLYRVREVDAQMPAFGSAASSPAQRAAVRPTRPVAAPPARPGRPAGVVNYNDLMPADNLGRARGTTRDGGGRDGHAIAAQGPSSPSAAPDLTNVSGAHVGVGVGAGFMEGPLPPQVRELIQQSCAGEAAEEAERQARRLLSTSRRVKVYRDELVAATEETADLEQVVQRHVLVCSALRTELAETDAKLQQLLSERRICEAQLQQEESEVGRQQSKLSEARERVAVLRNTVDNIARETQMGHIMLRQLVPNLHIDNYA